MRPLKFRFVAEIPTSPASSKPTPSPMHGPQPGRQRVRACIHQRFPDAALLGFFLHPLAGRARDRTSRPPRPSGLLSTFAAASRSSTREFTHETRYAFWIATFFFSISASDCIACTVSGPDTCGVTWPRSSTIRAAYAASASGAGGFFSQPSMSFSVNRSTPSAFNRCVNAAHVRDRDRVHREPSDQRTPLGGHVRDGKPRVHRKRRHARPGELDRRVQALVVVVKPAESDDDVLAGRARPAACPPARPESSAESATRIRPSPRPRPRPCARSACRSRPARHTYSNANPTRPRTIPARRTRAPP